MPSTWSFPAAPHPSEAKVARSPTGSWRPWPAVTVALGGTPAITPWDTFDEHLKSFAHMAVASLVGRTWCLDFDYFRAHNENAV
jgi:hypothetical protein